MARTYLTSLGWLLGLALVVPSCCVAVRLSPHQSERSLRKPGLPAHGYFPVVAVVPERTGPAARVLYLRDLPALKQQYPQVTFDIPAEHEARLRREATAFFTSRPTSGDYDLHEFSVEGRTGDAQSIRARLELDDDTWTVGWYDVVRGEIVPRAHLAEFGPGVALKDAPVTLALTSILWLASVVVLRLLARRLRLVRVVPPAS